MEMYIKKRGRGTLLVRRTGIKEKEEKRKRVKQPEGWRYEVFGYWM